MNFRHMAILSAALLVFPVTAQAETVYQQTTTRTTVSPEHSPTYKETTVLKGYKVTTVHPGGTSAPVAGQTYTRKGSVFVPVDQYGNPTTIVTEETVVYPAEYRFEKSYKGPTTFND